MKSSLKKINLQLNLLLFLGKWISLIFFLYLIPKKYPAESEVHTMINKKRIYVGSYELFKIGN